MPTPGVGGGKSLVEHPRAQGCSAVVSAACALGRGSFVGFIGLGEAVLAAEPGQGEKSSVTTRHMSQGPMDALIFGNDLKERVLGYPVCGGKGWEVGRKDDNNSTDH